ncbi:hypothetical protein P3X46_023988 [Hevea brasiliensis]|uniref:Bulb-type lectin domain-containing protein n=1 Tax=Hevea brasiliensis TaxID=3981 RepID=A0ABQ9LG56_HEVBR|nr:hypothetical protein P3X46_023988 [Hevea brasiliensis]
MNDNGNFVLQDLNSKNLWETFKNPTDTMLPSQILERGDRLSSRRSETNFSKGRFQFKLQTDGNLVLTTVNLPTDSANYPYYEIRRGDPGFQVVFNESGYLYLSSVKGNIFPLTQRVTTPWTTFYHTVTLNFDGVLIQYSYPKNSTENQNWTAV